MYITQDLSINRSDYTFAESNTGNSILTFGAADDCNGGTSSSICPRFGKANINTLGTGLILNRNVRSTVDTFIAYLSSRWESHFGLKLKRYQRITILIYAEPLCFLAMWDSFTCPCLP
jgi:hypothetical protein